MIPVIDLKAQYLGIKPEIDAAIQTVLESGQFIGGDLVDQFESDFSKIHKAAHCIGVGNGTDAILIALKCLDLRPGDEVIVPAFGWISASEMVTLAGGIPVFADVLPQGIINPAEIERKITSKTKGVIIVHLYGQSAHVHAIKKITDSHGIFLIEDCAQAHLTAEDGVPAGSLSAAGTFSFYPTKNLGAYGDGGCVITNDETLAEKMRLFSNHGGLQLHLTEGINSRLDPLQAAVLSVKLRHLLPWTEQRIKNAAIYFSALSDVSEIKLPEVRTGCIHTFHQFVIRTKSRDNLKSFLAERDIQTMIHYPVALPNLPAYQYLNFKPEDFPVAYECQQEVLSLPVHPHLTTQSILFICDQIKGFYR